MLHGNINIVERYREHKVSPWAAVQQLVKQRKKKTSDTQLHIFCMSKKILVHNQNNE